MFGKVLSERQYLILQMGFGTFIVAMAPIFWVYEDARPALLADVALGMFIILHTLYFDSRRTDQRIKALEGRVETLEKEMHKAEQESVTS
jgi:hypothetical protein